MTLKQGEYAAKATSPQKADRYEYQLYIGVNCGGGECRTSASDYDAEAKADGDGGAHIGRIADGMALSTAKQLQDTVSVAHSPMSRRREW